MEYNQVIRTIASLFELVDRGARVHSITTELVPDSNDPDFVNSVVVIKYQRTDQKKSHTVKVYEDGSMSDF